MQYPDWIFEDAVSSQNNTNGSLTHVSEPWQEQDVSRVRNKLRRAAEHPSDSALSHQALRVAVLLLSRLQRDIVGGGRCRRQRHSTSFGDYYNSMCPIISL